MPPVSFVNNVIRHYVYANVKEFWLFLIGLQLPFGPSLLNVGGIFKPFIIDFLFPLFGLENFSTPMFFLLLEGAVQYSVQQNLFMRHNVARPLDYVL